jgi:glycosyltransferase involved in cell wall biosynthesis
MAGVPRVRVVIPTFNNARFVGAAIQSVLEQSVGDFEVVVVDDGSTDATREVVEAIRDRRVVYRRQENQGPSAARNNALRDATNELVAFLDADDLWLPEKLARQLALVDASPAVGLVHGAYVVVDEQGRELVRRLGPGLTGRVADRLAVENLVSGSASTALVRRALLDRVGLFDESLRGGEDWDVWFRVARVSELAYVPEPIAKIRRHATNSTRAEDRIRTDLTRLIGKIYSDPTLPPELRRLEPRAWAAMHLAMARFARNGGSKRRALGYLLRAIGTRPSWPDPWIRLVQLGGDLARKERRPW